MSASEMYMRMVRKQFGKIPTERTASDQYEMFCQAQALYESCELASSLDLVKKCNSVNPCCLEYIRLIARLNLLLGRFQACQGFLKIGLKLRQGDPDLMLVQSALLQQQSQAGPSIQAIRQLSQKNDSQEMLLKMFEHYQRVQQPIPYKDFQRMHWEAAKDLRLGLKFSSLLMQNGNYKQAYLLLRQVETQYPDNQRVLSALGHAQQVLAQDEQSALKMYRRALVKGADSSETYNNLGLGLSKNGKVGIGIQCLKKALAMSPLRWQSHFNIGLKYFLNQQYTSAYIALSAACNLPQASPAICRLFLGLTLHFLEDHKAALKELQRVRTYFEKQERFQDTDKIMLLELMTGLKGVGDVESANKVKAILGGLQLEGELLTTLNSL